MLSFGVIASTQLSSIWNPFISLQHLSIFPSLYIYFLTTQHLPFTSSLMVMPLLQLLSSRPYHSISALTKAFDYWNMVVTWALSWNVVHHILPMSLDTLKAFTFDLVSFGCTSAVIKSCWAAIQNRHKEFEYTPPIHGSGQYSAWERCIASALGAPARIRFPVPSTCNDHLLSTKWGSSPLILRFLAGFSHWLWHSRLRGNSCI